MFQTTGNNVMQLRIWCKKGKPSLWLSLQLLLSMTDIKWNFVSGFCIKSLRQFYGSVTLVCFTFLIQTELRSGMKI